MFITPERDIIYGKFINDLRLLLCSQGNMNRVNIILWYAYLVCFMYIITDYNK